MLCTITVMHKASRSNYAEDFADGLLYCQAWKMKALPITRSRYMAQVEKSMGDQIIESRLLSVQFERYGIRADTEHLDVDAFEVPPAYYSSALVWVIFRMDSSCDHKVVHRVNSWRERWWERI
jgi:hypothetical protein